jgi:hypothetical protein
MNQIPSEEELFVAGLQFIGYPHAQILYDYSHSEYSKALCGSCAQVATGLAIVQG